MPQTRWCRCTPPDWTPPGHHDTLRVSRALVLSDRHADAHRVQRLLDVHAAVVHRDGFDLRPKGRQGAGVNEVARVGGDDDVAGIDQGIADQVKGLLRARREHEVVFRQSQRGAGRAFQVLSAIA